jgi:hypothetical protein
VVGERLADGEVGCSVLQGESEPAFPGSFALSAVDEQEELADVPEEGGMRIRSFPGQRGPLRGRFVAVGRSWGSFEVVRSSIPARPLES